MDEDEKAPSYTATLSLTVFDVDSPAQVRSIMDRLKPLVLDFAAEGHNVSFDVHTTGPEG